MEKLWEKLWVASITNEYGRKFYYVDFGSEVHGERSFRLWIAPHCLREDKDGFYLYLKNGKVIENCKIKITSRGNYVLVPAVGWWVAKVEVPCGYRGEGQIEQWLYPKEDELIILNYQNYHSPLGNLGIDNGYLVSVPPQYGYLKYRWKKTGRTYGAPHEGCTILFKSGEERELEELCEDEELQEIFEEIKEISKGGC